MAGTYDLQMAVTYTILQQCGWVVIFRQNPGRGVSFRNCILKRLYRYNSLDRKNCRTEARVPAGMDADNSE